MSFKNYGIYTIFGDYKTPKPKQYIEHFDNNGLNTDNITEHLFQTNSSSNSGSDSNKPRPDIFMITNGKAGAQVNWSDNVNSHKLDNSNNPTILSYLEITNSNVLKFNDDAENYRFRKIFLRKLLKKLYDGNHCHIHAVHIELDESGNVNELKARGRTNGYEAYQLNESAQNNKFTLILSRDGYNTGAIDDENSITFDENKSPGKTDLNSSYL